jgi:hypothetical protein
MTTITPTTQTARWLVDAGEQLDGTTLVGETTGVQIGLDVVYGEGEQGFLAAVSDAPSFAPPALPSMGTWLEAGAIYTDGADLLMVRQSHYRTEHNSADVPALFIVYRPDGDEVLAWVAGEQVQVGTLRTYGGATYRCLQAHVTQEDWTPDVVPALWAVVVEEPEEPPAGQQPWAVGMAYNVNDEVTYEGATYRCLQAHTSQAGWTPVAVPALWAVV